MICPNTACGVTVSSGARFCPECGTRLGNGNIGLSQSINAGGGNISGGVYQAGHDVIFNPRPSDPVSASYEAVPKWRSPFTQGVLSWIGLIIGLVGLLPLWKLVQLVHGLFSGGVPSGSGSIIWSVVLAFLAIIFVVVIYLHRISKDQLRRPLILGWAVSGSGRRITLERISAGRCPKCGGKMRYLNKPTKWIDHSRADGGTRREVTERVPALECRRNPKHWFEVDPAEEKES